MGDIIITITGSNPTTGALTLSDQGTTNAHQGDQVTWVIGPGSGVASIDNIVEKPNSSDVFSPDPVKLPGGNTNWQGTINPNVPVGTEEAYSIVWTVANSGWLNNGGGAQKTFDPIIRIQPKQ
jgi:hypothetical protein